MKKFLATLLAAAMLASLAACGGGTSSQAPQGGGSSTPAPDAGSAGTGGVELRIVSSFAGTDGNRPIYEEAFTNWATETGNKVLDESATSDETWKAKVIADFETGSEPDVLFFFVGEDANSFIESGKVVPLDEIRAAYPDYGSNMVDASLPRSLVDDKQYVLPTTGYWEGMFVNEALLKEVGVDVPGPDTTWDEFLEICEAVKDAGYVPIACALQHISHYWFEFTVMNNAGPANHLDVPKATDDAAGLAWQGALNDIADLYNRGFFPANTLSAQDEETFQLFYDGKAAFAVDGSWKTNQVVNNVENIDDYTVTYIPGKGERKATDIVGGLSMGFYITRAGWEDEAKRDAIVSLVTALTTDEVISRMAGGISSTALKNTIPVDQLEGMEELNSLQLKASAMVGGATSVTPAVQDYIKPEAKSSILETDVKLVANGDITAEEAVENMIEYNS